MRIELLRGVDGLAALADAGFRRRWADLYAGCAWGTVFQSPEFVETWFAHYGRTHEPLFLTGEDEGGRLVGLLPLARERAGGCVAAAGTAHAEYQTWLAAADVGDEFIERALERLGAQGGIPSLRLHFIPPGTPLGWMEREPWRSRCEAYAEKRGLIELGDGSALDKELKLRKNRYRVIRLERHGPVTFRHLDGSAALREVLDEIEQHCDLRQGAHHHGEPFRDDPHKRDFHLGMMDVPGLLQSSVMMAGDRVVSAQLNWRNRDVVLLGLLTHSPFFARHSPGSIHMLWNARDVAREGTALFDLSPGGGYKDRYATRYDEAHSAEIFLERGALLRSRSVRAITTVAKRAVRRAGAEPADVASRASRLWTRAAETPLTAVPSVLASRTRRWWDEARELRVYNFDLARVDRLPDHADMRVDALPDVLAYVRASRHQPERYEFLRMALDRLEDGEHVYTRVEDGRLAHYGWLVERQKVSNLIEVGQRFQTLPESAVLYDYFTHPAFRGRGLYRRALCQMLHAAARIPGTAVAHITVMATNAASRHVIETIGFEYYGSLFEARHRGAIRRWATVPTAPEEEARPAASEVPAAAAAE